MHICRFLLIFYIYVGAFTANKASGSNNNSRRKTASKNVDKLIKKPKGRAGRSEAKNGFNLQTEMLLDDDGARYDRLLVSFNVYNSQLSNRITGDCSRTDKYAPQG